VATVTTDGAPVADGTLVHFDLHGNPGEFTIGDDDVLDGSLGAHPPAAPIVSVAILDPFGR
jgi:hypothetical protein